MLSKIERVVVGPRGEPHDPAARHGQPSVQQHRDGHRPYTSGLLSLSGAFYRVSSHKCTMESLQLEQDKLDKKGSLSKTIDDVQKTIDLLVAARQAIAAGVFKAMSVERETQR